MRLKAQIALIFCLVINLISYSQPAGYNFAKQITLNSAQVSGGSPLINFPVLIDVTDADLATVGNGGGVENSNGFDIVFMLGDCSTLVPHDLEFYDATTGQIVIWVQMPALDNLSDSYLYMFYGNSSVSTDQSDATIWTSAGYDGVWHLHDDFLDSSGSGNNGTNNGSTDLSPAQNSADGQSFADPNHWIELTNHATRVGDFSYTGWARTLTNNRAGQRVICDDQSNGSGCHAISIGDPGTGRVRFYIRGMGPVSLDSPGGVISNNTWHYIAATFNDATNLKSLYVDGVLVNSATVGGTLGPANGNASIGGETATGETGNRFNGDLDEIRANTGLLSADWIQTEYNNQSSPGTFYSFSAQFAANNICGPLPIELVHFEAIKKSSSVLLEWTTASEVNNDFFTIQHSNDGQNWSDIIKLDGAGNSSNEIEYVAVHKNPDLGVNYYRLKQTDYNGEYKISGIRKVNIDSEQEFLLYPNPTDQKVEILSLGLDEEVIQVYNSIGQIVSPGIKFNSTDSAELNFEGLPSGIYFIHIGDKIQRLVVK